MVHQARMYALIAGILDIGNFILKIGLGTAQNQIGAIGVIVVEERAMSKEIVQLVDQSHEVTVEAIADGGDVTGDIPEDEDPLQGVIVVQEVGQEAGQEVDRAVIPEVDLGAGPEVDQGVNQEVAQDQDRNQDQSQNLIQSPTLKVSHEVQVRKETQKENQVLKERSAKIRRL